MSTTLTHWLHGTHRVRCGCGYDALYVDVADAIPDYQNHSCDEKARSAARRYLDTLERMNPSPRVREAIDRIRAEQAADSERGEE